ncbi:MAG TPA: hypothetical protein VKY19_18625 [Ktedonosporobacter sp.]|nr:hypothetical protein [Ktedonosporobacter sp.]
MGTSYLADFHGNIMFLLDPNKLSQFLSDVISQVPLLIQEQVPDGIGSIAIRNPPAVEDFYAF